MTINYYCDYCENEYNLTKNVLTCDKSFNFYSPAEIKHNVLQRLLGAGYLAQQMGASYQEVEAIFNFYKEKIGEIRETP